MPGVNSRERTLGHLAVVILGGAFGLAVGWVLFLWLPGDNTVLGVLFMLVVGFFGLRIGGNVASRVQPRYNVAEVAVEGPITRDGGGGPVPGGVRGTPADDIVDQMEAANDDDNVDALLVKLNTPGGEVVPSDDIRNAAMAFEGPTVAYATDTCASGGYWIASGCDELWARDTSIVGSIGVVGSRVNATDLADQLGLSYERFAAGKYKDAGTALRELEPEEREYLQGIVDDYYQHFVERVAQGRDMPPGDIRETEARVFIGERAYDLGLVDSLGTRDDVLDHVEDLLGESVSPATFEPSRSPVQRLSSGASRTAYAFGAGVASRFDGDDDLTIRL
ncbi:signal peptide peptidase SppA [Halomarina oriensis]|uniref:Signal peptide peptidase SppA n=1 Tax=Halomarina oriensis TaxID=671145 RepID=A0A6B0GSW9_9EURY|nr:signal peptide peptidase SppA [Halomarina oriensis]MWG35215.1 signal peptide peptidase SppA [Halomarina oriensis]